MFSAQSWLEKEKVASREAEWEMLSNVGREDQDRNFNYAGERKGS